MTHPITHAILIEPDLPESLSPLLEERPLGLLPVANQPLLHLTLSRLAEAGVRTVDLFVSHLPYQTRSYLQQGRAWGLDVRIHSVARSARLLDAPQRLAAYLQPDTLVMSLDILLSTGFLQTLTSQDGNRTVHTRQGIELPCRVVREPKLPSCTAVILREDDEVTRLDSLPALLQANVAELSQRSQRHHAEQRFGESLYLGARTRIHDTVQLAEPSLIGEGSLLTSRVVIGPETVIGANVVVDEHAEISHSLIFSGSYVGPRVLISGKVVDGARLIDIASGVCVYVDDPAILGRASQYASNNVALRHVHEWLVALLLGALVALPMLLWFAWRRLTGRTSLREVARYIPIRRSLDGNVLTHRLRLFELEGVTNPALAKLPWLGAVLTGRLRLVGTAEPLAAPAAGFRSLNEVYAMLAWQSEAGRGEEGPHPESIDYRFHNALTVTLRQVAGWMRRCW